MTNTSDTTERNFEIVLFCRDTLPLGLTEKVKKIIDIVIDGSVDNKESIKIEKVVVHKNFVNVVFAYPLDSVYSLNQGMNKDGWYVNWIQIFNDSYQVDLYLDL